MANYNFVASNQCTTEETPDGEEAPAARARVTELIVGPQRAANPVSDGGIRRGSEADDFPPPRHKPKRATRKPCGGQRPRMGRHMIRRASFPSRWEDARSGTALCATAQREAALGAAPSRQGFPVAANAG